MKMSPVDNGVADEEAVKRGNTARVSGFRWEADQEATLATKTAILDEFEEVMNYHRKQAIRLFGHEQGRKRRRKHSPSDTSRRSYEKR